MVNVPPGFRFHKGLDGLFVGITIVFVVRVEMVLSSLINWWRVPAWTYRPVVEGGSTLATAVESLATALSALVRFESGGGGSTLVSGVLMDAMTTGIEIVGVPVLIVGALRANAVEQLLIVIGFWVGFLVPLRWWVLRPIYFWWQGLDVR